MDGVPICRCRGWRALKYEDKYSESTSERMRTGERDVQDVLYRIGDKVSATTGKTSTLEDVDDVVPVERVSIPPLNLTV